MPLPNIEITVSIANIKTIKPIKQSKIHIQNHSAASSNLKIKSEL